MAAAILANLSNEELLAGSADEKIDRLLLLVRDGFKELKDQLSTANAEIKRLKAENAMLKTDLKNLETNQLTSKCCRSSIARSIIWLFIICQKKIKAMPGKITSSPSNRFTRFSAMICK